MKRALAAFLWFYATWTLLSFVAMILGVPDVVGPVVGIAAGLLVAVDPRHLIWPVRPTSKMDSAATA